MGGVSRPGGDDALARPQQRTFPSAQSGVRRRAVVTLLFAMAGIVVTEISTPISAPDLAEVSDSTPAVPAR